MTTLRRCGRRYGETTNASGKLAKSFFGAQARILLFNLRPGPGGSLPRGVREAGVGGDFRNFLKTILLSRAPTRG